MIEVRTFDSDGRSDKPISVSEEAFGGKVRRAVLREALLMYEANKRQGTSDVLRRAEVRGSTRKLWRQKHTGRARVGDRRSPIRRGGGVVWGPHPRDYSYSLPKKALKVALDSAILSKLIDGEVIVADCRTSEPPKTKAVASYLKSIGLAAGAKLLYVIRDMDAVFHRSARNIEGLDVLPLPDLNAYAMVRPSMVVFSKGAFEKLLEGRK
jgi:large subunit ribosomal protein L4